MGIEEQIDRLIDLGEDIKSRLDRLIEQGVMLKQPVGDRFVLPPESEMNSITFGEAIKKAKNHFADANKMVADEPPKKWRILELGEVVQEGDRMNAKLNPPSDPPNGLGWIPVIASVGDTVCEDDPGIFARLVAEPPAKEPGPAWEPKVGDWVRVTRPSDWDEWEHPCWAPQMHQFDGKVGKIESEREGRFHICGFAWHGLRFVFHRDWLSPAEPPASDKPPEPEYREPVLPADAGKVCEFSDDSMSWEEGVLIGWRANFNTFNWKSERDSHRYARIKKDA